MKNKTTFALVLFMCFILSQWSYLQPKSANQEEWNLEDLENYLRTAKIVSVEKEKIPGRTEAWKITLDDGKIVRRGHFKHVRDNRPTLIPDSYKYEIAAYELHKLVDLKSMPPIVEREIEGIKGSLQFRIENCFPLDDLKRKKIEPPDPEAFENDLEEINVFENLTFCERKELDDVLIHEEDWKVYRVDFSEAFSPTPELIPGQKVTRCSKKLFQNLQKIEDDAIKAKLKLYLNDEEIKTLLIRKKIILDKIKQLIEEKGEESVLF